MILQRTQACRQPGIPVWPSAALQPAGPSWRSNGRTSSAYLSSVSTSPGVRSPPLHSVGSQEPVGVPATATAPLSHVQSEVSPRPPAGGKQRGNRRPHGYWSGPHSWERLQAELAAFVAAGWLELPHPDLPDRTYFYNQVSGRSTWRLPAALERLQRAGWGAGGGAGGADGGQSSDPGALAAVAAAEAKADRVMPSRVMIVQARRYDLHSAITAHGGYLAVAQQLGRRVTWALSTRLYDDPEALRRQLAAVGRQLGLPAGTLPSQRDLVEAGEGPLLAAVRRAGGFRAVAGRVGAVPRARRRPLRHWWELGTLADELADFMLLRDTGGQPQPQPQTGGQTQRQAQAQQTDPQALPPAQQHQQQEKGGTAAAGARRGRDRGRQQAEPAGAVAAGARQGPRGDDPVGRTADAATGRDARGDSPHRATQCGSPRAPGGTAQPASPVRHLAAAPPSPAQPPPDSPPPLPQPPDPPEWRLPTHSELRAAGRCDLLYGLYRNRSRAPELRDRVAEALAARRGAGGPDAGAGAGAEGVAPVGVGTVEAALEPAGGGAGGGSGAVVRVDRRGTNRNALKFDDVVAALAAGCRTPQAIREHLQSQRGVAVSRQHVTAYLGKQAAEGRIVKLAYGKYGPPAETEPRR